MKRSCSVSEVEDTTNLMNWRSPPISFLCFNGPSSDEARPVVFFGDSITEFWSGLSYCAPASHAEGVPAVLKDLGERTGSAPVALGISGDQTQHLYTSSPPKRRRAQISCMRATFLRQNGRRPVMPP